MSRSGCAALGACVAAAFGSAAGAASIGMVGPFDVRWDTGLRATLGVRVNGADAAVLANINADDGDRAFGPGVMSDRLDLSTQIDAVAGTLGLHASADAWWDGAYHGSTANGSPATFNPVTVPYDRFPRGTRTLDGGWAELSEAYAQDKWNFAGLPVSVRIGRQTLLWGESLFFAQNGIAAGQAPIDAIKSLGAPLAEARELFLPVTQASARVQIRPGVSLEFYDQFEWRRDRLPGVASYFSSSDVLDAGGERLFTGPFRALLRGADEVPHGIGQFGVALRLSGGGADFGIYALRYDAKLPEIVTRNNPAVPYGVAGSYDLVFPRGIEVLGASASTYAGDANVASEISVRHGMPLVSAQSGLPATGQGGGAFYGAAAVRPKPVQASTYATGDTLHAQASIVAQAAPGRFWNGASLQAEIAANDRLGITANPQWLAPGRSRFAVSVRAVFTPQYFQVLPNLDVGVPIGIGSTLAGNSSVDASENAHASDVTAGLSVTWRTVWQAGLAFTHFIGRPQAQPLSDRDFVALSVERTF